MNKSACSAVICQPGGREQRHDTKFQYCYEFTMRRKRNIHF